MSTERPSKRQRSTVACLRCKRRKQRCDNGFPACAACLAAKQDCAYETSNYPAGYVKSLEDRVYELEHRLQPHGPDTGYATQEEPSPAVTGDSALHPDHGHAHIDTSPRTPDPIEDNEDGAPPPTISATYLGPSSGFPLAKMVQATISPSAHQNNLTSNTWLPAQEPSPKLTTAKTLTKATMPSDGVSERLIDAYLTKVHPKHPFLSPRRIHRLVQSRHSLEPASKSSVNQSSETRFDYFMLHMIYAIGSRYLQLSDEYTYRPPEEHYLAAMDDMKIVYEGRSLENLEAMTLLVIYQLRSPTEAGIWSIIGMTMRLALACGLHRASNLPPLLDQRRKRLFWTIYMLERYIARTLGRPFCISDKDIDVALPANVDDDIEDEHEMAVALEEAQTPGRITSMSSALMIFRMVRIETKIQTTMHRVDKPASEIKPHKIAQLRNALDEWKAAIESSVPDVCEKDAPSPYVTHRYHLLQYHKAMLFLLLPCLTWLPSTHPDFRLCAATAGQIGQTYKRQHNSQKFLSYSLLALHANLVAGLTLVYCYVADPSIFDMKFSSDIRACSTVLYIIAERWPAARKARDCLERFVQSTMENNKSKPSGDHLLGHNLTTSTQPESALTSSTGQQSMLDTSVQCGLEDLPQPNDIWDMLGNVLEGGDDNDWYQGGIDSLFQGHWNNG